MSYDLMVFEVTKAPRTREEFMEWFKEQTQWSEPHDYESISVTSPALKNWFMEMKEIFPPLNGEYAPSDEMIDADGDLEAHLADYSIGYDVIYVGFGWLVSEEANFLATELAEKHGVGFYDASNEYIIFPDDTKQAGTSELASDVLSVKNESNTVEKTRHATVEVKTQKEFLPFNFLKWILPMFMWTGLAVAVLYIFLFAVGVGGSFLLYEATDSSVIYNFGSGLMDFLEDLLWYFFWYIVLAVFILALIGAGLIAFYFQNIKIVVDEEKVSFWRGRGKKKYRLISLDEHSISSHINKIRYYFIFETTTRYLTVKKVGARRLKKYQCFGISEHNFSELINHILFGTASIVERNIETADNELKINDTFESEDCNSDYDEFETLVVDVTSFQNSPDVESSENIFPLTFEIDKEGYIKGYKIEILSNFTTLFLLPLIPASVIVFLAILGLPFYAILDILRDTSTLIAGICAVITILIIYRSIRQKMFMNEIQKNTPSAITIGKTALQIGNAEFLLDDIAEIRVTPPTYYTKDNLHTFRRYLTVTTKNGSVQRFLLGDADKAKWLYWVNFQKPRKNVFEDYAVFCQMLQIWLADENENRFKLELEAATVKNTEIEKKNELSTDMQLDEVYSTVRNDRSKEDILTGLGLKEKQMFLDIFDKNVMVTFQTELEDTIEKLLADLGQTISQHINELCKYSVENAVEFVEWTGEALHFMLDPEDEPEYIEEFMKKWNAGEIEELVSYYDRWYSIETATKIAQACKDVLKGKVITINELLQLGSETALKLGFYKYNFGNVYLAIREQLEQDPKGILKFMYPMGIYVKQAPDKTLLFTIEFQNDWETEHGIDWIIKDTIPIYVGQGGASLSEVELVTWNTLRGCSR